MTRPRLPLRAATAAALALALTAAGCGGDDNPTPVTTAPHADREVVRTTTTEVQVTRAVPGGRFDPATIYKRDAPSVVTITSVFGGDRAGQGSGFVVSKDGEIATNAHVVSDGEGANLRRAKEVYVQFPDGNQVSAKVLGTDPNSDVALIKVDPKGLKVRPLPLGRASTVAVGEPVAAIGSPFGEQQSLSVGVVSALNRSIESLTGFSISGAIQTDAAINRGNSGGPLLDARGEVLGINSQIRSASGSGSGVGFAVDVDTVRRSLAQLRRDGRARYAFLGISSTEVYPQLNQRFKLGTDRGAWVQEVVKGGPADKAGVRAGRGAVRFQASPYRPGGDVIIGVADQQVRSADDLSRALLDLRPGQTTELRLLRDGERKTLRVRLAERPADAGP